MFLLILSTVIISLLILFQEYLSLPTNLFGYRNQIVFVLFFEICLIRSLIQVFPNEQYKFTFSSAQAILFMFSNVVLVGFYSLFIFTDSNQRSFFLFEPIQLFIFYFFYFLLAILLIQIPLNSDTPFFQFTSPILNSTESLLDSIRFKWIFLAVVFVIGSILRLINLDKFPPQVDEYTHTHAAYLLLNGLPSDYTRGFLTVTIPILLSFKLVGVSLLTARIPMAILNMVAIFPLFNLGKKINPIVAMASVLLFTVNPLIIALARNVREYAIVPIFIFFTLDLLTGFAVEFEPKKEFFIKNKWKLLWAILLLVYFPIFDRSSVISVIMINYVAFIGLAGLLILANRSIAIRKKIAGLFISIVSLVAALISSHRLYYFIKTGNLIEYPTIKFFDSLVNNPDRNWNSFFPQIGYLFFAITIILLIKSMMNVQEKQGKVLFLLTTTFALVFTYMSLFMFSFKVIPRIRYGVVIVFHLVPIAAILFYWVYKNLIRSTQNKSLQVFVFSLIFFTFCTNYQSIQRIFTFEGGENHFVTSIPHYSAQPAYEYLAKNMAVNEVFLSNSFYRYNELNGNQIRDPLILSYRPLIVKQKLNLETVIDPYPTGWVAVYKDANPLTYGFLANDFSVGNKFMKFHGKIGDVFIWHWKTITE